MVAAASEDTCLHPCVELTAALAPASSGAGISGGAWACVQRPTHSIAWPPIQALTACLLPPPSVVQVMGRERAGKRRKTGKPGGKGKDWVLKKKEQMRGRGYDIAPDTKYTGRKRRHLT